VREASGKLAAAGVLLLFAYLLFKVVLGFVSFLVWSVIAVVAVIAVLWAVNRLL